MAKKEKKTKEVSVMINGEVHDLVVPPNYYAMCYQCSLELMCLEAKSDICEVFGEPNRIFKRR